MLPIISCICSLTLLNQFSRDLFGAEHKETITSMHNLAENYLAAGKEEEGHRIQELILRTLSGEEKIEGKPTDPKGRPVTLLSRAPKKDEPAPKPKPAEPESLTKPSTRKRS